MNILNKRFYEIKIDAFQCNLFNGFNLLNEFCYFLRVAYNIAENFASIRGKGLKKLLAMGLSMVMPVAAVSGTVDYLEVKDHVVYFSTSADKTSPPPSCVATDKADQWAVSLNSHQGRAMYSLILSAMAKGDAMGLSVTSAGNCLEQGNVEEANGVQMVASESSTGSQANGGTSNSGNPTFAIYAGDGTTRLGTVFDAIDDNIFRIFNPANFQGFSVVSTVQAWMAIDYMEESCSGQPYSRNSNSTSSVAYEALNGRFMKRSDGDRILAKPVSQRDPNGECVAGEDRAIYRYPIEPGFDETCGEYACTLRME